MTLPLYLNIFEIRYVNIYEFGRKCFKQLNFENQILYWTVCLNIRKSYKGTRFGISYLLFHFLLCRYESLVGTIGNKFKTKKRQREEVEDEPSEIQDEDDAEERCKRLLESLKKTTKFQFMKPSDD